MNLVSGGQPVGQFVVALFATPLGKGVEGIVDERDLREIYLLLGLQKAQEKGHERRINAHHGQALGEGSHLSLLQRARWIGAQTQKGVDAYAPGHQDSGCHQEGFEA